MNLMMSEKSHHQNPAAHSRSRPTRTKRGSPSLTHWPDPTANFIRLRASAAVGPESREAEGCPSFLESAHESAHEKERFLFLASAHNDNREKTVHFPDCTLQTKQSVKMKEVDDVFLYCGRAGSDVIGCRRPTGGVFIHESH